MPRNDLTESENCDQLCEPWLEDLLQPTHSRGHLCVFDSYSGFHFCVGKICIQKLLEEA